MARWIRKSKRIVQTIAVPVECLRIFRPRHNRIRAQEAPQLGIIPAGIVITQPLATGQRTLVILAGETFRRNGIEGSAAIAAKRIVVAGCQCRPRLIGDDAGTV